MSKKDRIRKEQAMPAFNALCCFLGALIWGTAFVAQKVGGDEMGPFIFNGLRFFLGFFVVFPLVVVRGKKRRQRLEAGDKRVDAVNTKRAVYGGMVCGVFLTAASALQQYSLQFVEVGKAGFLTALYIIMVPIISFLVTRKSNIRVLIGALIATAGLYCLSVSSSMTIAGADILLILCALMFSFQILAVGHFAEETDCFELAASQFLTAGILGTALAFIMESPALSSFTGAGILSLLYAGLFSSGIAYTLQVVGQKGADPAIASLIMSLESVISAVSGFLLLHQTLTKRELAGCVLMFSAIVLVQLPSGRKGKIIPESKLQEGSN